MKITFKKPSLKKEYLTILVDNDNISEKNKNDIYLWCNTGFPYGSVVKNLLAKQEM